MKRGQHFTHKHWLNPETGKPLDCLVTRIAQGVIYYRPYYGKHADGTDWLGSAAYFPIELQTKYVN